MPRIRHVLAVALLAVGAIAITTTALASGPHHRLPIGHSLVSTNTLPGGLHVSSVHMSVTPTGGRLRAHLSVTVFNPRHAVARRFLAVGACDAIQCRNVFQRTVLLRGGQTRQLAITGDVRGDAREIQGSLQKPGAAPAFGNNAAIELNVRAWTGADAGRSFGLTLTPRMALAIRNADWHISSATPGRGTMRLRFTGPKPADVATTLQRCDSTCASTTVQPNPRRSAGTAFDTRPVISQDGADSLRLGVSGSDDGAEILIAALPWPSP